MLYSTLDSVNAGQSKPILEQQLLLVWESSLVVQKLGPLLRGHIWLEVLDFLVCTYLLSLVGGGGRGGDFMRNTEVLTRGVVSARRRCRYASLTMYIALLRWSVFP